MKWYILQTQTSRENKVADSLKVQCEIDNTIDSLEEVVVPEERVIENSVSGKKRIIKRRFYPGYVFIKSDLSPQFLLSIKKINFCNGFIGGNKPTPMDDKEVLRLVALTSESESSDGVYKINFTTGEELNINDGPFKGFTGEVKTVNYDNNSICVEVQVFGRGTDVEMTFADVSKV